MSEGSFDSRGIIGISKIGNRLIDIPACFMRNGGKAVITGDALEPQDWSEFDGIGTEYCLEFQNTQDEIPAHAFEDDENLKAIIAPQVEKIGKFAFKRCFNLKLTSFRGARAIGKAAFHSCNKLIYIIFDNALSISSQAFMGCRLIERAFFPKTRYIGVMAFESCPKLKDIHIPCVKSERMLAYSGIISSEQLESIRIDDRNPRLADIKTFLEKRGLEHLLRSVKCEQEE